MYDIEMQEVSPEFERCWRAARQHLSAQLQDGIQAWMRGHLGPPFLEHLSFRLGNQLFFVRLEDAQGGLKVPGSRRGLQTIAEGCRGEPCLMPMRRREDGEWEPALRDWGLVHARLGTGLNPLGLVTDEKIEMTDWELHDFAVQVVRDGLLKEGLRLMSFQGSPLVDPALWFVGKSGEPEWVIVRAVRYPALRPERPDNWNDIAASCARLSPIGHFAPVSVASANDEFAGEGAPPTPLWRGHGMYVRYEGLED